MKRLSFLEACISISFIFRVARGGGLVYPLDLNSQNIGPSEDEAEHEYTVRTNKSIQSGFGVFWEPNETEFGRELRQHFDGGLKHAFQWKPWSMDKDEIIDLVVNECESRSGVKSKNTNSDATCWLENGERDDSWANSARVCMRENSNSTRIFAVHIRKAGGTTLRSWLGSLRCTNNFNAYIQEGRIMNVTRLSVPSTFFVTILRNPVERIWSSYMYEGKYLKKIQHARTENYKTYKTPLTFAQYYQEVRFERHVGSPYRIWHEVENYYVQVFSGIRLRGAGHAWNDSTANVKNQIDKKEVDWEPYIARAAAVLRAFDVVLITEWLSFKNVTDWATWKLGLRSTGFSDHVLSFPHNKKPKGGDTSESLRKWETAQLHDINGPDFRLYGMAQEYTIEAMARDINRGDHSTDKPKSSCLDLQEEKWGESVDRIASRICRERRAHLPSKKIKRENPNHKKESQSELQPNVRIP